MDQDDDIDTVPTSKDRGEGHDIWRLAYHSRATAFPVQSDLDALMRQAQARNHACSLTGMLLYKHGRFFQWLEGPRLKLEPVWKSIQADARHKEIVVMSNQPTRSRLFSGWDMRVISRPGEFNPEDGRPSNLPTQREFARQVAKLAVDNKHREILALIEDLVDSKGKLQNPAELFEAVARAVGDDWADDESPTIDVSIAMATLHRVVRQLAERTDEEPPALGAYRWVLVSTQPGETHILGSVLVADYFRNAGWQVEIAFPQSDQELIEAVRSNWFEAVTLSASDVFAPENRMVALTETIRALRAASINRSLVVCVGGRAFSQTPDTGAARVGADVGFLTADEAVENAGLVLRHRGRIKKTTNRVSRNPDLEHLRKMPLPTGWHWIV